MPSVRIQSLDRGLTLLEIVAQSRQPVSLAAMAAALGVDRSSAFRLANTLRQRGFLVQLPSGKGYVLGSAARQLAGAFRLDELLLQIAKEHVQALATTTGETAHLAIREGDRAALIYHQLSGQPVGVSTGSGFCVPLHCTSVGKALIADCDAEELHAIFGDAPLPAITKRTICSLPELARDCQFARRRGYALDDEENAEGVCCLSVPIRDASGHTVASIGVSAPVARLSKKRHAAVARQIQEVADAISKKLGRTTPENHT
jgi:IclR family transcriptional regulator, acetate operon repressor